MRRLITFLSALFIMAPAFAGQRYFTYHDDNELSISIDDVDEITTCDQIHVTRSGRPVAVVTEELPVGGAQSLRVEATRRGGARVTGYSGRSFSARACKASLVGDPNSVRVSVSGNTISSDDSDRDAMVFFLVQTPRGASVELEATNGQLAVDQFDGKLSARTTNGPIAVKNSTGTIDVIAVNGPIAFAGSSGTIKLHAQNGPVAVKLNGSEWSGTLDASTDNGPVALKLPVGYRSGIVVESRRGPFACRGDVCPAEMRLASRDYRDDRPQRIALGSGATLIHLSTVNGPVSIKERD